MHNKPGIANQLAVDVAGFESTDERLRGIEADELHLARRFHILKCFEQAVSRTFIGGEEAVSLECAIIILETGKKVLGSFVRGIAGGPAILVRAEDLDIGIRLDRVKKTASEAALHKRDRSNSVTVSSNDSVFRMIRSGTLRRGGICFVAR